MDVWGRNIVNVRGDELHQAVDKFRCDLIRVDISPVHEKDTVDTQLVHHDQSSTDNDRGYRNRVVQSQSLRLLS
jgi:hypothetical protein